jgi:hypothetical protein
MRQTAMSKPAEHRHEVKKRLTDHVYERLQIFKQIHQIEYDSDALSRIARDALFGVLPPQFDTKEPQS